MNKAIISLGANINPAENIATALSMIADDHIILAESDIIETSPLGYTQQPNFLNGAVLIETGMTHEQLTHWLKEVEDRLGRIRTKNKSGPRTIDLDIVVWNNKIVDSDVYERDFLWNAICEVSTEIRK